MAILTLAVLTACTKPATHTDLIAAAQRGDSEAIRDLVKRGAEIDGFGERGRNALMVAAMNKQTDAVNTLLSLGAKVSIAAKDNNGPTPLMFAVVGGDMNIVKTLLAKGANPDAKTNDGKSAIDIARSQKKDEIVALLEPQNTEEAKPAPPAKPAVDVEAYTGPMVKIPAGQFMMGSREGDKLADKNEMPQHQVTVSAFKLAQYEVTVQQFAKFVDATGHPVGKTCWQMTKDGSYKDIPGNWRAPGFAQGQLNPVACVSWDDAQAYVNWLSDLTGQRFRLPSEAEWEYAARAGSDTLFFWGDQSKDACRYANGADKAGNRMLKRDFDGRYWTKALKCNDNAEYTATVGSYAPNAFGLYDMIGNVWEWTDDCWSESYQGASTNGGVMSWGDCSQRVNRGGSWGNIAAALRAANRTRGTTGDRSNILGFRLAQDL